MTHVFEPLFFDPLECHLCGMERAHADHEPTAEDVEYAERMEREEMRGEPTHGYRANHARHL